MANHAILSASGASRWLACTPSARLESEFPDSTSAAASEGTLAHSLGELLIRNKLKLLDKKKFMKEADVISKNVQYQAEMWEYCENYSVFVMERFAAAKAHTKDAKIYLEEKLDMSDFIPEGFGTADVVIICDNVMEIIDLKYGKGVPVFADNNSQMKLYALAAIKAYGHLYDIDSVNMTIYQPRIDNISSAEYGRVYLETWEKETLIPTAKLAFAGEGEFVAGDHCRFCRASATCRANALFQLEIAKHDFKDPPLLNDDEISDILTRRMKFLNWLEVVEKFALAEAINNGKEWPGFKLVEGRSNRVYSDEAKVVKILTKDLTFSDDEIHNKKLKGLGDLEKLIGKTAFAEYVSPLLIKPPGKPTLVPEADKRPKMNTAEAAHVDFAEAIEIED